MILSLNVLILSLIVAGETPAQTPSNGLVPGKFGQAIDLSKDQRFVVIPMANQIDQRPLTFEIWFCIHDNKSFNILMAMAPKSGAHFEIYTSAGDGRLSLYFPQIGDYRSELIPSLNEWHFLAYRLGDKSVEVYLDGKKAIEATSPGMLMVEKTDLYVGKIIRETLGFSGQVDELVISHRNHPLEGYVPEEPTKPDKDILAIFSFEEIDEKKGITPNMMSNESDLVAQVKDIYALPTSDRFLDEVQEESYKRSGLLGDLAVDQDSKLPITEVMANIGGTGLVPTEKKKISLSGEWLLKESTTRVPASMEKKQLNAIESEGVDKRWFKEDFDRSDWRKIQVPTSVQNALVKLGEVPDPHWDTNTWDELQQHGWPQDFAWNHRKTRIEQKDWWFARKFELPADLKGQKLRLYCDGIDYAGTVYLNSESLGYHEGMFGGPSRDITNLVRFDKPNEVIIRVDCIRDTWFGNLKGSPGWGWHYGHLVSLGVWRDVEIQVVPEYEIIHPFVHVKSIDGNQAVIQVEYDLKTDNLKPSPLVVAGTISGKNCQVETITFTNQIQVHPGTNRYRTEVVVKNPKLWWPMNYGDPNLYHLMLSVAPEKETQAVDTVSTSFGIRTIQMKALRGQNPEVDYKWQFVVNGVPIFMKGANWCWSDPMLQVDKEKYEHFLELARRAGIQMFRCWGGGIIETDPFYELCDQKGLMVYQEFPYCWGPPDFPMTDARVLDDQVSRVVKRLRNHPALIMWGGGNENVQAVGADEGLFLVGKRCREFDPSRPFHRTSPWGGSSHNWNVFHGGAPIDSGFMNAPSVFYGEFGCPSMNNYDECLLYMPKDKMEKWPPAQDDGGFQMHMNQFGYGDMVKVMRYCNYGPIKSWKDYIDYSQMAQGDEILFACNLQRAGSYLNKGGLWFYKMTDLFPGHSWAVIGYYGHPKLSYFRAKQAFLPQAAFAHFVKYDWVEGETFECSLHVNNDSLKELKNVQVQAKLYGQDLVPFHSKDYKIEDCPTTSRKQIDQWEVSLPAGKIKPFLMSVVMKDAAGNRISDQWYWFNFQSKTEATQKMEEIPAWGWPHDRAPEAFEAYGSLPEARLLTLPRTSLSASIQQKENKGIITITNTGSVLAFNVLIDNFPYTYRSYLDENSFCLEPGEIREVGYELAKPEISLDKLSIRAWNADPVKVQ